MERLAAARKQEAAQQNQDLSWQDSIRNRLATQMGPAGAMQQLGGTVSNIAGDVGSFINSIAKQESGGNYKAVNRHSGAMGKYQVMPGNLGGRHSGWDYEALGYDIDRNQFMASPQIQDKIAQHKLQQYYNKYGPAGAAVAWYAGPGAANKYARSGHASSRSEANGYPSVNAYVAAILRKLGL